MNDLQKSLLVKFDKLKTAIDTEDFVSTFGNLYSARILLRGLRDHYSHSDRVRFYVYSLIHDSLVWTPEEELSTNAIQQLIKIVEAEQEEPTPLPKDFFKKTRQVLLRCGLHTAPSKRKKKCEPCDVHGFCHLCDGKSIACEESDDYRQTLKCIQFNLEAASNRLKKLLSK